MSIQLGGTMPCSPLHPIFLIISSKRCLKEALDFIEFARPLNASVHGLGVYLMQDDIMI